MCLGAHYGLGKRDRYIRLDWRGTLQRLQYVFSVLYVGYTPARDR